MGSINYWGRSNPSAAFGTVRLHPSSLLLLATQQGRSEDSRSRRSHRSIIDRASRKKCGSYWGNLLLAKMAHRRTVLSSIPLPSPNHHTHDTTTHNSGSKPLPLPLQTTTTMVPSPPPPPPQSYPSCPGEQWRTYGKERRRLLVESDSFHFSISGATPIQKYFALAERVRSL